MMLFINFMCYSSVCLFVCCANATRRLFCWDQASIHQSVCLFVVLMPLGVYSAETRQVFISLFVCLFVVLMLLGVYSAETRQVPDDWNYWVGWGRAANHWWLWWQWGAFWCNHILQRYCTLLYARCCVCSRALCCTLKHFVPLPFVSIAVQCFCNLMWIIWLIYLLFSPYSRQFFITTPVLICYSWHGFRDFASC